MPISLKHKDWDKEGSSRRASWGSWGWSSWRRFQDSTFVRQGNIICKELSFRGILRPIPPGECAITSLTMGPNYNIYGATSGKRAHLFRYRPLGTSGVVIDMGVIGKETAVRNSLVVTKDNVVVGGTAGGWIFTSQASVFAGDFIQEWQLHGSPIDLVLRPFKDEGIARLVYDQERDIIYGLTDKSGTLFIYDHIKKKARKVGLIDQPDYAHTLVLDATGTLYGAGYEGHFFRVTPEAKKIEFQDAYMPTFAGQNVFDGIQTMVFDPASGWIYGGGREHGTLFAFNPGTLETKFLGKPTINSFLGSLAAGNDGRIYGISGGPEDMAHFFCYDPATGSISDQGIPLATLEMRWYGYVFACMLTAPSGELYLGQSERVSNLFIYFPDIKKPVRPPA
jgi:hypothetical protein